MHPIKRFHRKKNSQDLRLRKHTSWMASPLSNEEGSDGEEGGDYFGPQAEQTRSQSVSTTDAPKFQHHHESSTVELFYDLFFVANLATFTLNHEMINFDAVKNYLGFFSLLWFTWLQTSLFDVRFAADSVFTRVCKAVSFGIMIGFTMVGALYDITNVVDNIKSFRAMAMVLALSRFVLMIQYGVVLWYVRGYSKVFVPLLSTMATMLFSGLVFAGTYFGFKDPVAAATGAKVTGPTTFNAWYVVVCVEALAVITISCIWRVVSFKHTHLVERIGLLTLIVMGEGILGLAKNTAKFVEAAGVPSGRDIGVITAAVLLIYFIWSLYFDQIEHDRFGTIRQQIWTIIHFPLHVAILLTVEGSANLISWNKVSPGLNKWSTYFYENVPDYVDNSPKEMADYLKKAIVEIGAMYKKKDKLKTYYDYNKTIAAIGNMTTDQFNMNKVANKTSLFHEVHEGVSNAIFKSYGILIPDKATKYLDTEEAMNAALIEVVVTVFTYFYFAAGLFLIVLAIGYLFGKKSKTWQEWLSLVIRVVFGVALGAVLPLVVAWNNSSNPKLVKAVVIFLNGPYHIPLVTIMFFIVIVFDNLLTWHTNKTIGKRRRTLIPQNDPSIVREVDTPNTPGMRSTDTDVERVAGEKQSLVQETYIGQEPQFKSYGEYTDEARSQQR